VSYRQEDDNIQLLQKKSVHIRQCLDAYEPHTAWF